jgi:ABC-type dipeptide/oligopeptide/nickel transport system permease component
VGTLNGAVTIEYIFVLPGLGSALVDAITARDYPVVQGILFIIIVFVLLANLAFDLIYTRVDPRVALE